MLLEKKLLSNILKKLPGFISHIYLMIVVIIGWVLFYFVDISEGLKYISILFGLGENPLYDVKFEVELYNNIIFLAVSLVACTPLFKTTIDKLYKRFDKHTAFGIIRGTVNAAILVICTIMLVGQTFTPFLYFKF
jgi:alginate O-acetyltransferase complex protein AlgI